MRKSWMVALLLTAGVAGCGDGGDTKTIFFVRILQGTAPSPISRIDLEVQKDATTFMVPLEATGGGALTLPITREVKLPDDQSGAVIVTATARNAAGDNVGVGRAPATIVPGETITLELMVFDVQDRFYDSHALVDNFRWTAANVTLGTHE